jgi:L-alanine-DL-glutamate epimerase-like enolase superfamily enzyme
VRVVEITGHHLNFHPKHPLGNARTFMRSRDFLALRITTDEGHIGWGEVFSSPWAAAALVRHQFSRFVLGRSPTLHRRIFQDMLESLGYDRRGPAMMAMSAIDMALHDAAARSRGISVAEMLGGPLRDRVFAYASGPFMREGGDPYRHYPDEVGSYLDLGFRALKPRAGLSPRADRKMIDAMRAQVGEGIALMVDMNQGYASGAARSSAFSMQDAGLLWIEEPVQPEDLPGYVAVARSSSTPIAGGEALASPAAFREFLEAGALSVLQPDLTVCGGFTGFQRIAHLADAYDLPVMPHAFSTTINFHASLQMASMLPTRRGGGPAGYPFVEWDPTGNPLLELIPLKLDQDGFVDVPDAPGLGMDLTPEMLEPWTVDSWTLASS